MRDRPDQTSFFAAYTGKVLFVGGEKDPLIPVASLEQQASRLKPGHARVEIIPHVGHMGMLENEKEMSRILHNWLETLPMDQTN